VRVRLEGQDHFINRLGRWDDPIAVAKAQAISAEIWRDYREGTLDWSLCRYKPLVEGKDPELLKALENLMLRKRQGRTTHAYRHPPGGGTSQSIQHDAEQPDRHPPGSAWSGSYDSCRVGLAIRC